MAPTVGRIVHYHPTAQASWAALVTDVREDGSVDLTVFPPGRPQMLRQNITEGAEVDSWSWPTITPTPAPADADTEGESE